MHLSSSTIAAKTVVAVPCPGEGNDPIFTEVVESKSSVNLSAPTAAPIQYPKHYPTMPSTIPLSQAAPHPTPPTIPSKQQSLNKSNICSLKQALEEYCSATIIVRISVFTQNLSTFASLQTIVLKTQGAVKRHTKNVSKRPNFKMSA